MQRLEPSQVAAVERLEELFRSQLSGVRFPDVDADTLNRLRSSIEAQERALEEARARVESVTRALMESEQLLLTVAEQGLAYAQLYARTRPQLARELGAIRLGPSKRGPGRPRKERSGDVGFASGSDGADEPSFSFADTDSGAAGIEESDRDSASPVSASPVSDAVEAVAAAESLEVTTRPTTVRRRSSSVSDAA